MAITGAGPHLMLDCYGCSKNILAPPYAFKQDKPHDKGITGVVILEESHVSFHSFMTDYVAIDVYSCKDYDENTVINFVKELFGPERIDKNFVHRGKECQQRILSVPKSRARQ